MELYPSILTAVDLILNFVTQIPTVCRILFVLDLSPLQIIFDECHKAKNATSTKMGKAVLDLQNKLPRARVVYASATGKRSHN